MWQNGLSLIMASRLIPMLVLDLVIFLTILSLVKAFPVNEKVSVPTYGKQSTSFIEDAIDKHESIKSGEFQRNYRTEVGNMLQLFKNYLTQKQKNNRLSDLNKETKLEKSRTGIMKSIENSVVSNLTNSISYDKRSRRRKRFSVFFGSNKVDPFSSPDDTIVDSNFDNTHVVPCDARDRNYCHHGGICVFVAELDIRTCR